MALKLWDLAAAEDDRRFSPYCWRIKMALPVRQQLTQEPYVCGRTPGFADYILFGAFQWARAVSPQRLLEPDDPVFAWRERLLDLHGGIARQAKGYPVWA